MPEIEAPYVDLFVQTIVKLGVAVFCGLLLGIEREWKDKPAGLRTIVLITLGSTLYMTVSYLIPHTSEAVGRLLPADPGRVAAQVVTGIGFLGAGTIIRARGAIHGLTTAAIIWVAAAVGLLVGTGFFVASILVTILVLVTLAAMEPLRRAIAKRATLRSITLLVPDDLLVVRRVENILLANDIGREDIRIEREDGGVLRLGATFRAGSESAARIFDAIAEIPGVRGIPYDGQESESDG